MLRERQINAFATLGGYIGMNAGLVLAAEREDEVAGVLSHEIAHVTQRPRAARRSSARRRDQLPILLAMLGAIVAAQAAGGNSGDDAVAGGDGVGAGPDAAAPDRLHALQRIRGRPHRHPDAGAQPLRPDGDGRLLRAACSARSRANRAATTARRPTTCRPTRSPPPASARPRSAPTQIAARRASWLRRRRRRQRQSAAARPACSLGPARRTTRRHRRSSPGRANACACSAPTARATRSANTNACASNAHARRRPALRPGRGAAARQPGDGRRGRRSSELLAKHPGDLWLTLALARSRSPRRQGRGRRHAASRPCWQPMPHNRAVVLTYAQVLAERDSAAAGKRAQAVLRPLLGQSQPTTRSSSRPSPAPARSPATRSAPARPTPKPPT